MKPTNALIIFAKLPVPGTVKTRLTPPLSPQDAAALYERMLVDTLATACRLTDVRPHIFYQDDAGAGGYFARLAAAIPASPQRGTDLGARMADAMGTVLARGYERVVIIGSDSPDLPAGHIETAFGLLGSGEDAVFGPAEDGGYYLIGMKRVWRELFADLPWSSPRLLEASLNRAAAAGIRTALLPPWYDIDTGDDLLRLLGGDDREAAPATREFLSWLPWGRETTS